MSDHLIKVAGRYTIRPIEEADFDNVLALTNAWEMRLHGRVMSDAEELRFMWDDPTFKLSDTRIAYDAEGKLAGYCAIGHEEEMPVRPSVSLMLDPEEMDFELGLAFYEWADEELKRVFSLVPDHAKVTQVTGTLTHNTKMIELFDLAGFKATGQQWQKMLIEIESEPQEAYLDPEVTIITADVFNNHRAVYDAHQDSFRDHRNFLERDREEGFKKWLYWHVEDPRTYDPSLWFIALVDGKIAGIALCDTLNTNEPDEGYVSILGVLPAYRGRGIAKYLLVHAFREYFKRGKYKVGLFVDGSSITGADRLYTQAGMHVARSFATYQKVMRDGEELTAQ
jgi:mycothiol synthase